MLNSNTSFNSYVSVGSPDYAKAREQHAILWVSELWQPPSLHSQVLCALLLKPTFILMGTGKEMCWWLVLVYIVKNPSFCITNQSLIMYPSHWPNWPQHRYLLQQWQLLLHWHVVWGNYDNTLTLQRELISPQFVVSWTIFKFKTTFWLWSYLYAVVQ